MGAPLPIRDHEGFSVTASCPRAGGVVPRVPQGTGVQGHRFVFVGVHDWHTPIDCGATKTMGRPRLRQELAVGVGGSATFQPDCSCCTGPHSTPLVFIHHKCQRRRRPTAAYAGCSVCLLRRMPAVFASTTAATSPKSALLRIELTSPWGETCCSGAARHTTHPPTSCPSSHIVAVVGSVMPSTERHVAKNIRVLPLATAATAGVR